MSFLFIAFVLAFFFVVFSQFGARLSARHSMTWWLVSAFIIASAIDPQWLRPVADLFRIETISNLVFAVLSMFLFVQMLEQSADSARTHRQLTHLTSSLSAESHRPNTAPNGSGLVSVLVVVPCYNEEENLPILLPRLDALKGERNGFFIDYCIVNDGSADRSAEVLRHFAPENHVTHRTNIGVAGV
jgi:hypothetical protein